MKILCKVRLGHKMGEILLRFLIGGCVVGAFALMGEVFRTKSFAGLFGAAPSVALATLGLTILHRGHTYAAIETRSMVAGAAAFFCYATLVSAVLVRFKTHTLWTTLAVMPVWFGVALGIYELVLRRLPV